MNYNQLNDVDTLSHTTWNCIYHIVFAPKYCRKVFMEKKGMIVRESCRCKGVNIITAKKLIETRRTKRTINIGYRVPVYW